MREHPNLIWYCVHHMKGFAMETNEGGGDSKNSEISITLQVNDLQVEYTLYTS